MVVFREWFWGHEFVYKWHSIPIAIAAALAILKIRDSLASRGAWGNRVTLALIAVIYAFAVRGLDDYYAIRHRTPIEIEMFKQLHTEMTPDQTLLTYQSYYMPQFAGKLVHLRPEVAWYLDRNMEASQSFEDVQQKAATGHYPFYLVDVSQAPQQLVDQLKARYPYRFIQGSSFHQKPHLVAGISDQLIFELRSSESSLMTAGLNALYQERNGAKAATYFRQVLAQNPDHYGANFQIAAALDLQGEREEANTYWKKTLALANQYRDTAIARAAERRLRDQR
jgi:tetratricopeptide (TPR) repeat protein